MFKVRLLLLTLLIGCGPVALPASELDPGATFAAHQVHNGFFIDRLRGGGTGIVEPARWISWPGSPQFRVRTEAATLGDLWLIAPARVEDRESAPARTAGNVEPAWDNGAIRLTLRPATGGLLRSGLFERIGGRGSSVPIRNPQTPADAPGTYPAEILDPRDSRAGWSGARIGQ